MLRNILITSVVFLGTVLSGCAQTYSSSASSDHINPSYVHIIKPYIISDKEQYAVLSINEALKNLKLNEQQRAQLYYESSIFYSMMGLNHFSRMTLMQAIMQANNVSSFYSSMGLNLALTGNYLEAFDAFDSAIELDSVNDSIYFFRGIVLFYGKRYVNARQDFAKYYHKNIHDPYRLLWLYYVEKQLQNEDADQKLRERYRLMVGAKENHLVGAIEVILGLKSEQEFWDQVLTGVEEAKYPEVLCESYYYLGKYHQLLGHTNMAKDYFKLALMTHVTYFVEFNLAEMELKENKQQIQNVDVKPDSELPSEES